MEVWDLYDRNGKETGKTHVRGNPLEPGDFHMVVENWIVNSRGEYLIQKRNKPLGGYHNPWSTTAGSATKGDTSLDAVHRETAEEMGLKFKPSDFKFIERCFYDDFFMDVYETVWDGESSFINFDKVEVQDVKWATREEIQKMYKDLEFYSHKTNYLLEVINNGN